MSQSHCVVAEDSVFASLFDCDFETMNGDRVFRADVYETFGCADSVAGDHHRFDYGVGIAFENRTVHECARVALVGVTYDVLLIGNRVVSELPLHAGGESAAASAAKSAGFDRIDNLLLRHFGNGLFISKVAVERKVLVDVFGVDKSAVTKHETMLALVESGFVERFDFAVYVLFLVKKSLHYRSAYDMFADDFFDVRNFYVLIERAVRINDDDRTAGAKSEAAGHDKFDFFFYAVLFEKAREFVINIFAVSRSTAGTAAHENMSAFERAIGRRADSAVGNAILHRLANRLKFLQVFHYMFLHK